MEREGERIVGEKNEGYDETEKTKLHLLAEKMAVETGTGTEAGDGHLDRKHSLGWGK